MLFGATNTEKPFPKLDLKNFTKSIKKIDKHYNNQFGLKSQMVNVFTKFKSEILNENPIPNRVLAGKDGWYFLGNHNNELFNDSFGNHSFSMIELEEIKKNIQSTREELASRGIDFYIVVPPNKHRVYSEKLPYQLQQNTTRLEALNSYLKKEIDFEIIDLRDTLVANKNNQLLYYKTNTHWNDIGAFIGYQKTINAIDPNIPKVNISNYNIDYDSQILGDITNMINLKNNEREVKLIKKTSSKVKPIKSTYQFKRFMNYSKNRVMVMYRDSFSDAWIPFFNESFRETIYLRGYHINYGFIDHKKPDIVIFEIVERNLSSILLHNKKSPK